MESRKNCLETLVLSAFLNAQTGNLSFFLIIDSLTKRELAWGFGLFTCIPVVAFSKSYLNCLAIDFVTVSGQRWRKCPGFVWGEGAGSSQSCTDHHAGCQQHFIKYINPQHCQPSNWFKSLSRSREQYSSSSTCLKASTPFKYTVWWQSIVGAASKSGPVWLQPLTLGGRQGRMGYGVNPEELEQLGSPYHCCCLWSAVSRVHLAATGRTAHVETA